MYQSGEVNAKLQRVIDYLGGQSYAEYISGTKSYEARLSLGAWHRSIEDACDILKDAQKQPDPVLVVIIDEETERRLIAASIPDNEVISLLPYQARVGVGDEYFHIVNESGYTVTTRAHYIYKGDTLCGRQRSVRGRLNGVVPTCPGCLAKAKNQVAFHLQQNVAVQE